MPIDPIDPLEAALRANRVLQERVAELERQLARSGSPEDAEGLGTTVAEREALLSEAEHISHMGSWVWDLVTNKVHWSDELYRLLGYDPDADVPSIDAFFARIHPEDRERIHRARAQGLAGNVFEQTDFRILRPDGSVRYVTSDGAVLTDSNGAPRRAVGTVLDVTDARNAARELERTAALLAGAQRIARIGSFEVDAKTGHLTWSDEMFRIADIDPADGPSTELFLQRLHEGDRQSIHASVERALQSGQVEPSRARIRRRDGSTLHVDMRAEVIRGPGGELLAIRGTVNDVTELVRLEAQFHQSQKMEAVGQLAGGLAHDYNNLLTVILGNAQLLLAELDRPELREIVDAATTARSVTDRLLTFSRQGVRSVRVAQLSHDVEASRELVRRAAGGQVDVRYEIDAALRPVLVDSGQVQQMLLNLALNARDAMPAGGTLRISTQMALLTPGEARQRDVAPGDYAVLCVSDTGHGMDESTRSRAFEPFFTTKESGRGSGLGLAMVFGTMRQSGGFAEVSSEPGRGATFRLWFPCADGEPELPEAAAAAPPPAATEVLLVEDDPAVARVVSGILQAGGYRVRLAASAREALSSWMEAAADVLVTDVAMPDISGVKLGEMLRQGHPQLRILFVTGYSPDDVEMAAEPGRTAIVSKPFQRAELLAALSELLRPPA